MRTLKPFYLLLFFILIISTTRSIAQGYVCVSTEPVTGQITICWSLPGWVNIDELSYYRLQWSIKSGDFTNLNYIKFSNPSLITTYTIPIINGNINRYYFRIYGQLIDGSAFEIYPPSNIYLTVAGIENRIAKLSWNRDWINSIGVHLVQRLDNGVWNTIYSIPNHEFVWDTINNIPSHEYENFSYNDTLTNSPSDTTEIKYRILFKPVYGDCYSVSNIKSLDREPLFFMPNAFKPGGINNKFRPVQSFVDPNGFMMQIYDKWGQMIFETTDIIAGWDGIIKGSIAADGLYVYNIRYKSLQGGEYEKRGTVMLVK